MGQLQFAADDIFKLRCLIFPWFDVNDGLMFYIPVNSYGHVSSPNHVFLPTQ